MDDIHTNGLKFDSYSSDEDFKPESCKPTSFASLRKGHRGKDLDNKNLYLLFDSGASDSMIKSKYVKKEKHNFRKNKQEYSTAAGIYTTNYDVKLKLSLTEFNSSKIISHRFQVDNDDGDEGIGYDMIIGRDLMESIGMILDFQNKTIQWENMTVSMKNHREAHAFIPLPKELKSTSNATDRAVRILDSNYQAADLDEIVENANQLNSKEKALLLNLLKDFEDLFDGTLGHWNTEPVDIELEDNVKPSNSRYYPVPRINKDAFRKEILRLVEIGVLTEVQESAWGTPTFIIPKKNGTVRVITDFRKVNKMIKKKSYPIPRISDTLQQLEGFQYATALDLNMGYYTIKLNARSRDIMTIVTEFGKFQYNTLPMGMCISGDIFSAKINELLGDLEGVKTYLDDVLAITKGTFEEHVQQLRVILDRMQKAGLKVNASKCSFGMKEIPYLGYIISREGIMPDPKKIQGIMDLERPTTTTEIRRLVGMVQYYRDLYQGRSHVLAPLAEAASGPKGKKIPWTDELEVAFNNLKKMVSKETVMTYPDWNLPFDIYTDASDLQLGAVISQNNKPIAFFSRKLNKAQRNYTTTEKELLSIVECLKQFKNILFGYKINVFSDHKNLVYAATISESQRVMRWRLLLEEFGPNIQHIPGKDNIVADALSRLPTTNTERDEPSTGTVPLRTNELFNLNRDIPNDNGFPLEHSTVQRMQQNELNVRNSKLKALMKDDLSGYSKQDLNGIELIMYKNKIYVPKDLRGRTINWYHHYLNHPGGDRLANTLLQTCYWKGLTNQAKKFCKVCDTCQRFKKRRSRYGYLPPKNIGDLKPWNTVHIDLIGPYTVEVQQNQPGNEIKKVKLQLTCMTFLDPATGWFEIAEVPYYDNEEIKHGNKEQIDKTSARISQLFDTTWLARYPRPLKVIFDNGSEFKKDFVILLKDIKVKPTCTTVENPQGNSPVERVHQVIHNMIITKDLKNKVVDYINPWGEILSSVAYAIRASYHSTLGNTPSQLVFGRDMLFNLNTIIDWKLISAKKQKQVDYDNLRENRKRIDYDYSVGEKVYINRKGVFRKFDDPKYGPFRITDIYTNGTVRIQKGSVNERINIRRLEPHFDK